MPSSLFLPFSSCFGKDATRAALNLQIHRFPLASLAAAWTICFIFCSFSYIPYRIDLYQFLPTRSNSFSHSQRYGDSQTKATPSLIIGTDVQKNQIITALKLSVNTSAIVEITPYGTNEAVLLRIPTIIRPNKRRKNTIFLLGSSIIISN